MLWFVMLVALLNLGLGYLAAMALADSRPWTWLSSRSPAPPEAASPRHDETATPAAQGAPPAAQAAAGPAATAVATMDELPHAWLEELAQAGVVAESYLEAAAQIIKLRVGHYREQLIAAEVRARVAVAAGDAPAVALVAADLSTIHQEWLERQEAAVEMLRQRGGRLGDDEDTAQSLEQLLLDQAAKIREVSTILGGLAFQDAETDGKHVLARLAELIDAAHSLRDGIQEHLATMLRTGKRLDKLAPLALRDAATGLANRIGSEAFLEAWNRSDEARSQPLSIALFDIDRFAGVNQRLGTRVGDQAIAALGNLLDELVRKDRGFDRLARHGGQSFFMLLGDTRPHSALTAVERARQSIEATTFDDQGTEFELTISCGVTEAKPNEPPAELLKRAHQTLRFAKKQGRNRCAIDDGEGPTLLDPPQFHVQGRVISLNAS